MSEWFSEAVENIMEQPWWMWLIIAGLVAFGVALIVAGRKTRWSVQMLAHAALCLALSFVLSCIRILRMPQGGSITPGSMLPMMMFAYAYGTLPGLICGVAYGLLQFLQGTTIVHPIQFVLDYIVAFSVLGLAGLIRNAKNLPELGRFMTGIILAGLLRMLSSTLSGAVFFGEYAPEGQSPIIYSLIYNLTSIGVDTLLCAVIAFIPGVRKLPGLMRSQTAAPA